MPDLHERLTAAVNRRLELARAAGTPPPSPAARWWVDETGVKGVFRVVDGDDSWVAPEIVEHGLAVFIASNDPETVIEHCVQDLEIIDMFAKAKAETRPRVAIFEPKSRGRQGAALDHASAMGRLAALGMVAGRLAEAYGVEVETDG